MVDETFRLSGRRRGATLKEEVWQTDDGVVVKYSLAYISPHICGADNGRVLGYDSSHGFHHRHFMGATEELRFESYSDLAARFRREVEELWRREDEERR